MIKNSHQYHLELNWTGNLQEDNIKNDRRYEVNIQGKPTIHGSADKPFHGDPEKYNPEDLLMASLSACHMMSFFYVCRKREIQILSYKDEAEGVLSLNPDGSGQFDKATLKQQVTVAGWPDDLSVDEVNKQASKLCFIKNSINFPVDYQCDSLDVRDDS